MHKVPIPVTQAGPIEKYFGEHANVFRQMKQGEIVDLEEFIVAEAVMRPLPAKKFFIDLDIKQGFHYEAEAVNALEMIVGRNSYSIYGSHDLLYICHDGLVQMSRYTVNSESADALLNANKLIIDTRPPPSVTSILSDDYGCSWMEIFFFSVENTHTNKTSYNLLTIYPQSFINRLLFS